MLQNPGGVQGDVNCYWDRVAELWFVECIKTLGKAVGSDVIKRNGPEGKIYIGDLLSFFVSSQTVDEFVDLDNGMLV